MKHYIFTILFSVGLGSFSCAQSAFFNSSDSIEIQKNEVLGLHFSHKLKTKQTIYSLGKFFNRSVNEILQYNVKKSDHVFQLEDEILVPFDNSVLLTDVDSPLFEHTPMLTVYYTVKSKDNLFRISRELFPQQMDHLMINNRLRSFNLDIGQKIIVGWIPLPQGSGKSRNYKQNRNTEVISVATISQLDNLLSDQKTLEKIKSVTIESNKASDLEEQAGNEARLVRIISELEENDIVLNEETLVTQITDKSIIEEFNEEVVIAKEKEALPAARFTSNSGIAIWDKQIKDHQNLFVLHKSAKVNTFIELHYPLLNTSIKAKVVGNIPKGIYPKEVDVIISPKVAKKLGVIDGRFQIDMKYYL